MKIVVTGASGQLGHELMRQSSGYEHGFVFTDLRGGKVEVNDETFDVVPMDIADQEQVTAVIGGDVDVVINCAAYTDVNAAETERELASRVNVQGPKVLAEAAKNAGALLIHISTDYIFDGKNNVPYTENDTPSPLNFYGLTKYQGEQEIISSGCKYMIFRASWLYSIFGKNFFLTMEKLTAERPELNVVCDQTGTPTCAGDLAYMLLYLIENEMLDKTGIYNYSNEGTCSWYDFAAEINELLGHTCHVKPCKTADYSTPAVRPSYSVLDKSKFKATFGLEIPYWRDSLRLVVQEYLNA